jgi:F0F1-type ATP synthase membrane subunit a
MSKVIWGIAIFVVIGFFLIYSTLQTNFSDPDDVQTFVGAAFEWVGQIGKSTYTVGKTATEQDWLPPNTTFIVND